MSRALLCLVAIGSFVAVSVPPRDARACGGCFHPQDQPAEQSSVVTSHRMALSISPAQTVLWDQVQYAGAPADFAWVLPVKAGARLEVASDAWFEALDAATASRVSAPQLACATPDFGNDSGMGCAGPPGAAGCSADSSDSAAGGPLFEGPPPPDPVTVVHEGSVGPYETVTLHSDVPGALSAWLVEHGYAIDADIQPVVDAYGAEAFDFIALRLSPQAGVQQMRPVRVVQPGAVPTLPLRMVAAGTGANVELTLFVLGEARWTTKNFPAAIVDPSAVQWDFATSASSYSSQRAAALMGSGDGRTWLTSYAVHGSLLGPVPNAVTGGSTVYLAGGAATTTIADAFVQQALANGETQGGGCAAYAAAAATSNKLVVEPCPPDGGPCATLGESELAAESFVCPPGYASDVPLDDLAVAMTGMHPRDLWLTRLEANLPRAALATDLELEPEITQSAVDNWMVAGQAQNAPCPLASSDARGARAVAGPGEPKRANPKARLGAVGLRGLFALVSLLRRLARPRAATR